MRAVLLSTLILLAACSDAPVDPDELPAARLAGEACRVPLLAGAVVLGDGLVLTAAHVLAGAEDGLSVQLASGEQAPARVVGFDTQRDLALLAAAVEAPAVRLAEAATGDRGLIVSVSRTGELLTVRHEVVREITATGEDVVGDGSRRALELAADVAPGMSGAGVYDEDGRLLGVVFAESRERPITYAVTAAEIEAFLDEADPATAAATGEC